VFEQTLRDAVHSRLVLEIGIHQDFLSDRTLDSEAQIRVNQGIVRGLKMADAILTDVYRDQNG
jgi:hypothetical protein